VWSDMKASWKDIDRAGLENLHRTISGVSA
jgi:hypothetical protein